MSNVVRRVRTRCQGIFWLATIPAADWVPPGELPAGLQWIRGQRELGDGGFEHWQVCMATRAKCGLLGAKSFLAPTAHVELSRSDAASAYVWKEATRVADSQFELGAKPFLRSSGVDWQSVWENAKKGDLDAIPPQVRVSSYRTLRAIGADFSVPPGKPIIGF